MHEGSIKAWPCRQDTMGGQRVVFNLFSFLSSEWALASLIGKSLVLMSRLPGHVSRFSLVFVLILNELLFFLSFLLFF